MKKSPLFRALAACAVGALLLAGCGGGGGGGGSSSTFGSSERFSENAAGCSVATQKRFVRSYMDEVYLFYREIPNVDASQFTQTSQIGDYFEALTVPSKDRFSAALFTGLHQPVQSLVSRLAPGTLLQSHSVPAAPTFTTTGGGRVVGYVQLRNMDVGAQDEMISAFRQLQAQGVQDVILDLRNNTGGFVYVAQSAASMITGPSNNGQVFERLVFNDKRGESSLFFDGTVQFADGNGAVNPVGTTLPQLGLPRVFILTGGDTQTGDITCSASESIINSLRGVNVQVVRIGDTTCGKPYGFTEKDNCGWSFFAIEFQGFNAQGFGDYQAGFQPTCRFTDNVAFANRGTGADPLFNAALFYADNNACPAGTFTGVQSASVPLLNPAPAKSTRGARRLLPSQQPR